MKYHTSLSDHIQTKKHSRVLSDLDNTELDMTYNEGEFFILCIRNNSYDILNSLLGYFEENQLNVYKSSFNEYHILKNQMRDILRTAVKDVELSTEMKQVLSPYLNFEDSDSDIANLSDVSAESLDIKEKLNPSENLLTEENLRILNQKFAPQKEKNSFQDAIAEPLSSIIHDEDELNGNCENPYNLIFIYINQD
ncbi:unnamed protein product [Blepharisma stoltei]|uniref:Uncharacterized protein n=1 Tax=Blepharisma stoltei TaxID=1481888 RepID=A0AAU9INJ5_9CILI|nr:unnamed protein product [Blepharisma stoltei]